MNLNVKIEIELLGIVRISRRGVGYLKILMLESFGPVCVTQLQKALGEKDVENIKDFARPLLNLNRVTTSPEISLKFLLKLIPPPVPIKKANKK